MSHVLPFKPLAETPHPGDYSAGYIDGLRDGERCTDARFFWFGVFAGLFAAIVVAATIYFTGGSP